MTLPLSNNAEGGTDTTTVTTVNSGGTSGDAWSTVTIGASATLKFSTTQKRNTLSYEIATPATSVASYLAWSGLTFGTQTNLFVRVYAYLAANPVTNALRLINFFNGGTEVGGVLIQTSGGLQLRDSAGNITGASSAIALDQWIRIECSIVCNASTGSIEVKLFNTADSTTPTDTLTKTSRNTGTQLTIARFGETSTSGTITARTFYLEDIQANITAYPGPSVTTVVLGGAGSPMPIAVATVPAPTVVAQANITATPDTVPAPVSIATPSVSSPITVTPSTVAAAATVSSPTLAGTAIATPSRVAVATTVPIPNLLVGGSPRPVTVAARASIPYPAINVVEFMPESWGPGPWGEFPWGGAETPGVGGAPIIGRDEFPAELPPLEHRIIGPNGETDFPAVVSGFAADEEMGFATLSGAIEAERVRDQPDIYTDGAQWIVTDSATGLVVSGGDLLTPAIGGGMAWLKADGWSKRLLRHGERLMYAARGYSALFVPKNSEPYGGDGIGFYTQGEDRYNVSTEGALRWHIDKGTDDWHIGDRQGFVADFTGLRRGVRRVTGHIRCSFAGPHFKFYVSSSDDPVGPLHGFTTIHDFTSGSSEIDFDIDLEEPGPIVCFEAVRTTDGVSDITNYTRSMVGGDDQVWNITFATDQEHGYAKKQGVIIAGVSPSAVNDTYDITFIPGAHQFRVRFEGDDPGAYGSGGTSDVPEVTGRTLEMTLNDLVLYGIASDDKWSASDVGRDIAGRLGFATRIDESVFNVLPLDTGADGVYADPLDIATVLSGMYYRVVGIEPGLPVLEMRRLGKVRWEIIDPEFPVEPIPLPRYDSVLVPYTLSNGVAQSVLEVTAEAIGQPMLPIARAYGPVSLPDPLPNASNATLLGQQILARVYQPRFAGEVTFSRVYGKDGFASAHEVHAQDNIVLPLNGGISLAIKALHREGGSVSATFDDGIAPVDRLLARKARKTLLRHPQ